VVALSSKPLDGLRVCYVSTAGFGGVWRTWKQAGTLADAGAAVVIAGYEEVMPHGLAESGHEIVTVPTPPPPTWPGHDSPSRMIRMLSNRLAILLGSASGNRRPPTLLDAVVASRPDVIQAVDLPSLEFASAASSRTQARLIYATHELWAGFVNNPDSPARGEAAERLLAAESTLIHRADLVTVTSDQMGDRLVDMYGVSKPLTLLNSPPERVERTRPVSRPVRLVYHGGLSGDRNVEGLIRAVAPLRDRVTLDIHGFDRTLGATSLQRLVDELDLGDSVRLHGPFEYRHVVGMLSGYDVGVMTATLVDENFEVTLPNKVFDCMCAGVAIAMYDSSAIRALLADVPFGITLDTSSPDKITRDLGHLVSDPERIAAMKAAAVGSSAKYWWPEQGRRLVEAVGELRR
jgi:glycosyltransferase involved in cell wall biosynthesis